MVDQEKMQQAFDRVLADVREFGLDTNESLDTGDLWPLVKDNGKPHGLGLLLKPEAYWALTATERCLQPARIVLCFEEPLLALVLWHFVEAEDRYASSYCTVPNVERAFRDTAKTLGLDYSAPKGE